MELHWIRVKLYEWGLRNRVRGIGYPSMAATEKARVGRGGSFSEPSLPQDLEEIDHAVACLEPHHRLVIAECYTHSGSHSDHMIRLRMSPSTYFRRKNVAEKKVYCFLQRESDFLQSMLR